MPKSINELIALIKIYITVAEKQKVDAKSEYSTGYLDGYVEVCKNLLKEITGEKPEEKKP